MTKLQTGTTPPQSEVMRHCLTLEEHELYNKWSEAIASWPGQPQLTQCDVLNLFTADCCHCVLDQKTGMPVSFIHTIPLGPLRPGEVDMFLINQFRFGPKIVEKFKCFQMFFLINRAINIYPNALFVFAPASPAQLVAAEHNGFIPAAECNNVFERYRQAIHLLPPHWLPTSTVMLWTKQIEQDASAR